MSFAAFLQEKQFLQNVSANTLRWYRHALTWLPSEHPSANELKSMVVRMRQRGMKETGCNAAIRAINCYLHWASGSDRKCGAGCSHPRIAKLKEPKLILPIFTDEQVKRLLKFKPRTAFERRLHLLILILLDTGCRITEALSIQVSDIDLNNLLLTLNGKGDKQRKTPISFELRKAIYKYLDNRTEGLLFTLADGGPWSRLNALNSVKFHCRERLGFEPPVRTLHAIRHTFATNYIRKTGSLLHLQKALGHETLTMAQRYAHLVTADLEALHPKVSLLSL